MVKPPRNPSSTEDDATDDASNTDESAVSKTKSTSNSGNTSSSRSGDAPRLLEDIDKMSPENLADYLYALAEEIIASPKEYKMKMGLETLDISELDNIDLNSPEGRRKLAKLFRLLAEQVLKGKAVYQATVTDKSKQQPGRGR